MDAVVAGLAVELIAPGRVGPGAVARFARGFACSAPRARRRVVKKPDLGVDDDALAFRGRYETANAACFGSF